MLREIRESRTTDTLLQLLEAAADDASQGTTGSSASTTTRADLSAAAMEKHASDPALWTTDVAVAFGKLMSARARAGLDGDAARAAIADGALSASDAAAADAAVASPLAVLLSKEEARSRCAMIAFMCATTVQLFAVLIFSVAVNRSFGYFYALNIALFLISVLPLLVVLIHTALTCCSHEASRQLLPKLLLASEVYYIGLHLIALLGVISLVKYLVTITAPVDEWCGKYFRLPIVNGTVSGATSSSRCPAKDSSSYDWMVVGAAAAAVGSCALFLAVVELGCRLASKWASLARFSATDGLTRSMAEDRGALPLLDDDARPVAATAAAALSTPLSGTTNWIQKRMHLSSLCISLYRRDLDESIAQTERNVNACLRCAASFASFCEAFSRMCFGWLGAFALIALYWIVDTALAIACWSSNDAATCVVSNGLTVILAVFVIVFVVVIAILGVLGGGNSSSSSSTSWDGGSTSFIFFMNYPDDQLPWENGKSNFTTAMIVLLIPAFILVLFFFLSCARGS